MGTTRPRRSEKTFHMPGALHQLFGSEADERAVLSVCCVVDRDEPERWRLRHGSLLIVPEACATTSWAEWRRQEANGPEAKIQGPLPPSFCLTDDDWFLARSVMTLKEAEVWIEELRERVAERPEGESAVGLPRAKGMPPLIASLRPPDAVVRALPGTDAPAASLLAALKRPAQALIWSSAVAPRPFPEPQWVELDQHKLFNPSVDLVGIHITSAAAEKNLATPVGLLVGRAERRAWIRTARGSGDFEAFIADLGWEPNRVDLTDLELTHEEHLAGELVSSARVRLEDLDTDAVEGSGSASVSLPTLGRTVAHSLSLNTLDGELLDRSGPYPLVERIEMTMVVNGHRQSPVVSGTTESPPDLDQRMVRADELASDIQKIVDLGVQARVIADRQTAFDRLAAHLRRARGELLIRDPYFGQDVEEWRLLDDVPVPVRVLTAKIAKDGIPVIAKHVQARYRPRERGFHERVYLWDEGGLSIGGSPTTFGQGHVRMTRIRPSEAAIWRAGFEAFWDSPLFSEVPRRTATS